LKKRGIILIWKEESKKTQKATTGPSLARDSSKILQILTKSILSSKKNPTSKDSFINSVDLIQKPLFTIPSNKQNPSSISRLPFSPFMTDFYISDSLSKYSTTMAKCSNVYRANFKNFI
jgi:hypothetical protein